MDPQSPTTTVINDLTSLTLVDGLPVVSEGRTLRYKRVRLRETTVADERAAQRESERVVLVNGMPKLLASDADFRFALTAKHIESFECDGKVIGRHVIDLELIGKLSTHDLGLIEQRVFLINLAAEVRYGAISQAELDAIIAGTAPQPAPQPRGQAGGVGQAPAQPQPGPALLADFTGDGAPSDPPAGDGR